MEPVDPVGHSDMLLKYYFSRQKLYSSANLETCWFQDVRTSAILISHPMGLRSLQGYSCALKPQIIKSLLVSILNVLDPHRKVPSYENL